MSPLYSDSHFKQQTGIAPAIPAAYEISFVAGMLRQ
jgi:hypothetical protein